MTSTDRSAGVLGAILARKEAEVATLRSAPRRPTERRPLEVVEALRRRPAEPLRLIAEIKRRSPSAGPLSTVLATPDRAMAYAEGGAAMISVLCDGPFFDGSWADLAAARRRLDDASCALPLLAKEFIVDPRQIQEARDRGADAVLLIARVLAPARLMALAHAAKEEGIEPLVEVVDERELDAAVAAEARIIGVNARDLDTLAIDPARARRVLAAIPTAVVAVHLSGLRSASDVSEVAQTRADAALLGEALMRDADPRPRLRAFVIAAGAR